MTKNLLCSALIGACLWVLTPWPALAEQTAALTIDTGRTVSIEYTLKLDDGSMADTNMGDDPLVYTQGKNEIIPALEQALQGLSINERKAVILPPEKAYGVVQADRFQAVPLDLIPEDGRKVGERLILEGPNQETIPASVHEVKADEIVLNLNHPLAGETLHFDVRILDIQ